MKKRLLSALLAFCMVLTIFPATAFAVEGAAKWDGVSVDTEWYTSNKTASSYTISTAAELAGLATLVNDEFIMFAGKTIELVTDIDLNNQPWTAIGQDWSRNLEHAQFRGNFNGNNHLISNLYVNVTSEPAGLFGQISRGTIQDLNVTGNVNSHFDSSITYTVYGTGGIVASTTDTNTIQNCSFAGSVTGYSNVGGIVGSNNGNVRNCSNSASVIAELQTSGGIVGSNSGTIELCNNTGTISTTSRVSTGGSIGGIAGESRGYINQCYNTGNITGTHSTGGIIGSALRASTNGSDPMILNCYNTGSVSISSGYSGCGGIVGDPNRETITIDNCYNIGSLSGEVYSGTTYRHAIVGGDAENAIVSACFNLPLDGPYDTGGTPITAEQFAQQATFDGWDFGTIWEMSANLRRPILKNNPEDNGNIPVDPDPVVPSGPAVITALYPANGSTFDHANTSSDTRMRIFFDREVSNGGGGRPELDFSTGTLEVYEVSDDTLVYRVQYGTEASLWNVDGSPTAIVFSNATTALDYDTEYYVTMPEGFVKLADGSVSPAIEKGDWRFTTKVQQVVDPAPTQDLYPFEWNENDSPINSLSDNLVITMTALAKLGYSTFSGSDKNKSVADFIDAKKYSEYSELYEKYSIDAIWDVSGRTLGSYGQFYRDIIGNYIVYDYCDSNNRTGFYAVCFKSPDGKYIISYRGSEGGMGAGIWHLIDSNSGTSSDWSTDLDFAFRNTLSEQFSLALDFYFRIRDIAGEENIILTGHSLGGALAGYVSLCTGARAYTIDGAVGHIIDTTFWEPFWTVYNFTGVNSLNLVNLTDELGANLSWPIDVGDAIQATKLNKYPMVTYQSLHPRESTQVEGIFSNIAGSHHALSYLTYNQDTHRYTLGQQTMIYNCDAQWENDIVDYIPMIKAIISSSNLSTKLKNLFGQLIFNRGRVQLGTTGNDVIKAPSIIGIDSFVNNRQFGGYGTDKLTGYFDSDVLVSKGNGSVLDGQGGSDIYFIDNECRYTIIDDPGGNDTIILRNWDFDSIAIQDTGEFVCIADSQRLVTVNKNRSIFSKNKIEVLWANNTCSQTKTVCSDLIQEATHSQNRMEMLSLERSTSEASAIRLIAIEGTAEISIYNSEKSLISDTIFSNKESDSTVYTDYAYYYGYNNDTDDRPYAVLYLFNDGYTVNISSAGNISAALYQYNNSESELISGSYIENLVVPEAQTLAIVSDGSDEGFYLVEGDNGTKIDNPVSFIYAQSVSLSQTNINLKIGSSIALFANATPIEAIIDGNWYSSNHNVATVDGNGKVTACGIGNAEISFVSINGKTASCNVTVISTGNSGEVNDDFGHSGNDNLYSGNDGQKYTISVPSVSGGKISVNPSRASKGRTVTLTATPNEGHELAALDVTDSNGNELELTDKGNGKYTFTMPASNVTVSATFAPISSELATPTENTSNDEPYLFPFTDVLKTDWFCGAVEYVFNNELMSGTAPYTFDPQGKMSRAMVWTVLGRMADADVDGSVSPWYAKAQAWATTNNVSDGTNPNNSISRQELMTMLWRYVGSPAATADLSKFSDSGAVADWADAAMQWAVSTGFLVGDNGRLNPVGEARRCEVATIFMRFCESIVK